MTLTFGSRQSNGRNVVTLALGGNAAGIASTGGPPVLAITVRPSFASAVRVGPTSCPRSSFARVPWVTSTIGPASSRSSHHGGGRKSLDGGGSSGPTKRMLSGILLRGYSNSLAVSCKYRSGSVIMASKRNAGKGREPCFTRTPLNDRCAEPQIVGSGWLVLAELRARSAAAHEGASAVPKNAVSALDKARAVIPSATIGTLLSGGPSRSGKLPQNMVSTIIASTGKSRWMSRIPAL